MSDDAQSVFDEIQKIATSTHDMQEYVVIPKRVVQDIAVHLDERSVPLDIRQVQPGGSWDPSFPVRELKLLDWVMMGVARHLVLSAFDEGSPLPINRGTASALIDAIMWPDLARNANIWIQEGVSMQ